MTDRYDTAGNPEDEYYPGTSVLTILEDIRDSEELPERETELHLTVYEEMFDSFDEQLTPDLPSLPDGHYVYELRLTPVLTAAAKKELAASMLNAIKEQQQRHEELRTEVRRLRATRRPAARAAAKLDILLKKAKV